MRNHRGVRRTVRSVVGCVGAFTIVASIIGGWAFPASATVYTNATAITIPSSGQATPYPSTIAVPTHGIVADVKVTLTGFTYAAFSYDVDVLLVGPTGKTVVLMADNGSTAANANLTFDDAASALLPGTGGGAMVTGTYKPSNAGAFNGTAPAPAAPYGATLSVFDGSDPNGTWSLFAYDDTAGGNGSISGGWTLDITYASVASFAPTSGKVGDSVVLTGVGFTGATVVKFGNTLASAFTVDSDVQITATVPAGAGTGAIAVTTPTLGTLTSSTDFVVNHARNVSIALSGKKAKGDVTATDGFTKCASTVPVNIQHLKKGKWKTVAGVLTKSDGSYKAVGLTLKGKYRAVAKKTTLPSGDVCVKDISPVVKK
jgi:hypothetical protein